MFDSTCAVPITRILLSALNVKHDISGQIEVNFWSSGLKNVCLITDDSSLSSSKSSLFFHEHN